MSSGMPLKYTGGMDLCADSEVWLNQMSPYHVSLFTECGLYKMHKVKTSAGYVISSHKVLKEQ
ncbi:hypothetical protein T08_259 [Trichinella sp. T8]|nr:hypothetical protein T08_5565 [Trichinella sp. T8]KRZ81682.1 hypothetical protein T08_259 [Trichinella sp. T8]